MSFDPASAFLKCVKGCDTASLPEFLPNGAFVCRCCGHEWRPSRGAGAPPRGVATSPSDPGWRLRPLD